jgi:hypothetical protein
MSATEPDRSHGTSLAALRLGLGLALVVAPTKVLVACGGEDDRRARIVARVLGARHLVEAGVLVRFDTAPVALAGAAVDGIHAATALAFAAADGRRRRLALLNAAGALFFTAAGIARAQRLR